MTVRPAPPLAVLVAVAGLGIVAVGLTTFGTDGPFVLVWAGLALWIIWSNLRSAFRRR